MKANRFNEITGSPGCYSTGKSERAHQLGLNSENEESFEGNQSFPRAHHVVAKKQNTPDINKLKKFELSSVNFLKKNLLKNHNNSILLSKINQQMNNTTTNPNFHHNNISSTCMFDKSWAFYNQFAHPTENHSNISTEHLPINNETTPINNSHNAHVTNPNKALVVINGRTSEILTANNISCELFGLSENDLIGRKLKDLFDFSNEMSSTNSRKQDFLMESDRLDENGKIVLCSGKIFDAYTDADDAEAVMPVSIYMLKLTDELEPKCLCAMEPVQRVTGTFAINVKGQIRYYNPKFSYIFGFTDLNDDISTPSNTTAPSSLALIATKSILHAKDIHELIPCLKLPMGSIQPEIKTQTLTGRTWRGENIPLRISITNKQVFNNEEIVYNCVVSVYTNISGLITVDPNDLKINSCNATFSRLLFGFDEKDLINKPITFLLPNFLNPENTTTANTTRLNTTNKMTPLATNNSYLNINDHSNHRNSSSRRHQRASGHFDNKSAHIVNPNQANGSFIESPSTPTQKRPKIIIDGPVDKTIENERKVKVSVCRCCAYCGDVVKESGNGDALVDFNMDYSPNRKCKDFIETNTFLPGSPATSMLMEERPNGFNSVKKSLLAKAISNNTLANEVQNFRIEENTNNLASSSTSLSSSNSSITSITTIEDLQTTTPNKSKKLNRSQSFSALDISEFEVEKGSGGGGLTKTGVCFKCALLKRNGTLNVQNNDNDTSVVSLIATTDNNDSSIEEVEFMHDQVESEEEKECVTVKAKLSKRTRLSDNENVADNEKSKKFKNQVTSTPAAGAPVQSSNRNSLANQSSYQINDGMYFGRGRHNDGSYLRIFYHRQLVNLTETNDKSKDLICVWISRDPYSDKSILDFSMEQSSMYKPKKTLNQTINESSAYSLEYEDLVCLGRGASGFVELAKRKLDKFEVVTKYILKSKIYKENWITDSKYANGKIPLECSILCKLDHTNIIKVLDVFQDIDHVQMVMEKHGCGMDLFEFIDRQRKYIEEPLACHIFKQIMSAVSYMHAKHLVHRDIKDENIVINQEFHIKLIDFGSTAYVVRNRKFATFCGTLDYCSPDVLLGNKYFGPELDVWTCGIALYTLVFSENPFVDAEETIECVLKPPFKVSKELMKLLFSILCANPDTRATVPMILSNLWLNQSVDMSNYKWEEVIREVEFHGNNAGDIFRAEEERLAKEQQQQQNKSCVRLERIVDPVVKSIDFDGGGGGNQMSLMSKSF